MIVDLDDQTVIVEGNVARKELLKHVVGYCLRSQMLQELFHRRVIWKVPVLLIKLPRIWVQMDDEGGRVASELGEDKVDIAN